LAEGATVGGSLEQRHTCSCLMGILEIRTIQAKLQYSLLPHGT